MCEDTSLLRVTCCPPVSMPLFSNYGKGYTHWVFQGVSSKECERFADSNKKVAFFPFFWTTNDPAPRGRHPTEFKEKPEASLMVTDCHRECREDKKSSLPNAVASTRSKRCSAKDEKTFFENKLKIPTKSRWRRGPGNAFKALARRYRLRSQWDKMQCEASSRMERGLSLLRPEVPTLIQNVL